MSFFENHLPVTWSELLLMGNAKKIDKLIFKEFIDFTGSVSKPGYQLFIVDKQGVLYSYYTQKGRIRRFSNIHYAHNFIRKLKIKEYSFINTEFEYKFDN